MTREWPARASLTSSSASCPGVEQLERRSGDGHGPARSPVHVQRLAGEGEAGLRGGPPGDLYIFLALKPHPFYQRDGADLHCRVPISMVTAALGGGFDVPTINGEKTRVKVPEGTQSGRRFRLGGKGMPVLRAREAGDMYVQVLVETPQKLTKRQKELLQEFEQQSSSETQPEAAGFFSKVKEFLDGLGNRQGSA